ncbi:MAG TPA: ABC transporter permease [Vicinamibacterales bacterium]|nr:ABC transporter permease [Vicinamibacterales bacterium]
MGEPRRPPFWFLRRQRRALREEIDEELRAHLQMRTKELMARGHPAEDAWREAVRQFGDLARTRSYCEQQDVQKERRKMTSLIFEEAFQDTRISLRSLLRAPILTLTIVATVGLGIGATTVIFTAIRTALLRPLPYAQPDRVYRLYTDTPPFKFRFSMVDYLALREQQTQFEQIAVYTARTVSFSDGVVAERLQAKVVSSGYFSVLGIKPAAGRDLTDTDNQVGRPSVIVLSNGFWQRRFGGRMDVIGTRVRIDGVNHEVVGVLPASVGPLEVQYDLFIAGQWPPPTRKGPFLYTVLARLRPGVSASAASSELREINRRLFPLWKSSYQDDKATWALMDLQEYVVGDVGTMAGLALAAVALVWLIGCANAAGLIVARVTSRRRELAVRASLGASRVRVMRFLITESALLAFGAAVAGAAIAWAGIRLLHIAGADYFPRTHEVRFDAAVVWLLAGLSVASTLLFGLIPALHGTGRADESLRDSSRSSTGSVSVRRLRSMLVGGQFAIATPLLIVAALLLASLNELRRVELGFDRHNLLTASIQLPAAKFEEPARIMAFFDELKQRLDALPGVTGVAYADGLPPDGVGNFNNFDLEAFPAGPGRSQPVTPWVAVSPEYFRVLGLNLLEGRLIDDRDAPEGNILRVVVDRAWARRFFPNGTALGKRFREGGCTECEWTTVVGVVSEVKYAGLDHPDEGTVYTPIGSRVRSVLLRTSVDPVTLVPALRAAVREMDHELPVSDIATVDELVTRSLQTPRSLSVLVASLALVALTLSLIGIYGVMTYYVQQHGRDIGIRLALGGSHRDVLQLVVGRGMRVVGIGLAVGVAGAFVLTRWISSLLFGVDAADALTFTAVSLLLAAVGFLTCVLPGVRASRLDPAVVLRTD